MQTTHKDHKRCPLLWKHICVNTNGSLSPCCEITKFDSPMEVQESLSEAYNKPQFKRLRQQMLDGESNEHCERICYKRERQGFTSKRLSEIAKYEKKFGTAFTGKETTHGDIDEVNYLDVKPSNFCNSKCVMCNNNRSSQFALESKKHRDYKGPIVIGGWYPDNSYKFQDIYKRVWRYKINGGETSVMPELEQILKEVAEGESPNSQLVLNINNTFDITKFDNYLQRVNRVSIGHSIEGWGTVNDYIRYPAQWNSILPNLKKFHAYAQENKSVDSSLIMCIMSLNYLDFPNALLKMHKEFPSFDFHVEPLHQPRQLRVNGLTRSQLELGLFRLNMVLRELPEHITSKLENIKRFYQQSAEQGTNQETRTKLIEYCSHMDHVRGINIQNYIPELQLNTQDRKINA